MEFQSTLLREKFVIRDSSGEGKGAPIVAVSNRMVLNLPLATKSGPQFETYVVRAQTMHSCVRFAAKILQTFEMDGPITGRAHYYDWASAWEGALDDHERKYNEARWGSIYLNGEPLYTSGKHHSFLDIIETCEQKNKGGYEQSLKMAERAFAKLGKNVSIEYDGGVALVMNLNETSARSGLVIRTPERKTSFNFLASSKAEGDEISATQCLLTSANFLECIQLAFRIGNLNEKLRQEAIPRYGREEQECEGALRRLGRLTNAIKMFEQSHVVRYRPEAPDFERLIKDAETYTRHYLEEMAAEDTI
jgi:hypothetical protein